MDRFKLHSTLMDTKKVNERTKQKIIKRGQQLEKLQKKLKERAENLAQLRRDDIIMRQDLSTYQAKVEEKFDVSGMCENVMVTIATR